MNQLTCCRCAIKVQVAVMGVVLQHMKSGTWREGGYSAVPLIQATFAVCRSALSTSALSCCPS